jgi:hypothetical protein
MIAFGIDKLLMLQYMIWNKSDQVEVSWLAGHIYEPKKFMQYNSNKIVNAESYRV